MTRATDTARSGNVDALLRRFYSLAPREQLDAYAAVRSYLDPPDRASALDLVVDNRRDALAAMALAASELGLPPFAAPTARQFNNTNAAAATGWNAARTARVFGRWSFACDDFRGGRARQSAAQRAAERAARKGVYRDREDYLRGIRLWLDSHPASRMSADYEFWRNEYNSALPPGELPLVSYSMLRKAFACDWSDLIEVALGRLSRDEAVARSKRHSLSADAGPHDLISFATVRALLGLSTTSAQRATRLPTFPRPAYTHPRPPKVRLWRRDEISAYLEGRPCRAGSVNELQDCYLDARGVAAALGLAVITVTTGSSPRVPQPTVRLGGLQLWLREDVESKQATMGEEIESK